MEREREKKISHLFPPWEGCQPNLRCHKEDSPVDPLLPARGAWVGAWVGHEAKDKTFFSKLRQLAAVGLTGEDSHILERKAKLTHKRVHLLRHQWLRRHHDHHLAHGEPAVEVIHNHTADERLAQPFV